MGIIVKNIKGASKIACNCDSWLDHWKNCSGDAVAWCSTQYCLNPPEVGGRVMRTGLKWNEWYIIPLCKTCNNKTTEYKVSWLTTFAPGNVGGGCGK